MFKKLVVFHEPQFGLISPNISLSEFAFRLNNYEQKYWNRPAELFQFVNYSDCDFHGLTFDSISLPQPISLFEPF